MSTKSKGIALILASIPGIGPMGFDKLYVGSIGLFIAQLVCTLLIIGLLFSGPYAFISALTLTLCILFGTQTFLYPKVNWAPTTTNDKIIAWIIVGLYVLGIVVSIIGASMSPKPKPETFESSTTAEEYLQNGASEEECGK